MDINIPKDLFKNVPARAWVIISIGITILMIFIGMTLYKYGEIAIKVNKSHEKTMNDIMIESKEPIWN